MNMCKKNYRAFTLIEAVMAIAILAAITSSVLVVMNRCVTAAIDIRVKMQAFETARENMEKLLASASLSDMTEYGYSEQNPDIEWQTSVQSFYEPVTSRMWMEAVCSATYYDSNNEQQKVELTHWLTDLTKEQILKILDQQKREAAFMDQTQYEEYITELQEFTNQYLEEQGLDVDAYVEFIEQQQQERLDWLDENEYNKEDYNEFTQIQREEEEQFLRELGIDPDEFDEWKEKELPNYLLYPGSTRPTPGQTNTSDSPTSAPTAGDEPVIDWSKIPKELWPFVEGITGQKAPQ